MIRSSFRSLSLVERQEAPRCYPVGSKTTSRQRARAQRRSQLETTWPPRVSSAPKGPDRRAQGNTLGGVPDPGRRPERAVQVRPVPTPEFARAGHLWVVRLDALSDAVSPFQGEERGPPVTDSQGVALGFSVPPRWGDGGSRRLRPGSRLEVLALCRVIVQKNRARSSTDEAGKKYWKNGLKLDTSIFSSLRSGSMLRGWPRAARRQVPVPAVSGVG
jgi:hypothetical protein